MPLAKVDDSDEDWDYSGHEYDSDMPDSDSDSDEEFQEDFMHRAILGRPRSKIYDSKDYVSEATGRAERSGLDAGRLEGTNDNWKATAGPKRQRKSPEAFEAGSASCFKRTKPEATADAAVASSAASTPLPPVPAPQRGRSRVRKTARQQHRARNALRAERRLEAQQQVTKAEHDLSDDLFLEFSWRQRRSIAISSYASALLQSCSKTEALKIGAIASRASWQSVKGWVRAWKKGEGELAPNKWGKNSKVPSYFQDEEAKLKAAKWWRSHQPKQGAMSFSFRFLPHCFAFR